MPHAMETVYVQCFSLPTLHGMIGIYVHIGPINWFCNFHIMASIFISPLDFFASMTNLHVEKYASDISENHKSTFHMGRKL